MPHRCGKVTFFSCRDHWFQRLPESTDQIEKVTEPIVMSDMPQDMTIGAFRAIVRDREKERRRLITEMNECGKEGQELERQISKALYSGLPGLSDAVVDVILSHRERAAALDTFGRRAVEQIKFGDSEAAMSLLKHFEQDEITVSDTVRSKFTEALAQLKLAASQPRRARVANAKRTRKRGRR